MTKTTLLSSVALGVALTFGMGAAAHAADADCVQKCVKPVHHKHHKKSAPVENPLVGEVAALKAEVAALEGRLDSANAAAQSAQASAQQAQAAAAAAQASAQQDDMAIKQIPGDVNSAVAALPKPKTDAIYLKNGAVKLTLGGFIAAESIYRSHNLEQDISSSFGAIPFKGPNGGTNNVNCVANPACAAGNNGGVLNPPTAQHLGHTSEWRETARQSRISALAQGDVTPAIHLAAYGELDFQGAAQTANSNESNSYNLRIRHLYTTVDWDTYGLHLLAGQNWSLVTLNSKGISPRNEVTPLSIEAQYVPGFAWARQPQIRLVKDFAKTFWLGLSLENAQTTLYTTGVKLLPGYSAQVNGPASSGFFAGETGVNVGTTAFCTVPTSATACTTANGDSSVVAVTNTMSINQAPDVVGKLAFEKNIAGHQLHLEALGVYRTFTDRVYNGTGWANVSTSGGGGGFGATFQVVPNLLDINASGLFGKGIGRYGTSQLPDTYLNPNGALEGIREDMALLGVIVHPTTKLDIYFNAGEEREFAAATNSAGGHGGFGNVLNTSQVSTAGCFSELSTASCATPTRYVQQFTGGFWDKVYQGSFGSFRVGAQYSYTKREGFNDAAGHGAPKGDENMIYTSIRYYPF